MDGHDGMDAINREVADSPTENPPVANSAGSVQLAEELRTPLLSLPTGTNDVSHCYRLRQRGIRIVDGEGGTMTSSRILDRSGAFRQSRGRWSVHRLSRRPSSSGNRCCCRGRLWNEWNLGGWFHRLAYQRTGVLMLILFVTYATIVTFFATMYLTLSKVGQTTESNPDGSERVVPFCQMEINNKMEALYLSLSTMASIGYGVSNYYFSECWSPFVLTLSQVCSAILFDAVAVGLLFHRISRGRKRSRTIAFSDKAVIQRVKGIPYLMFRMGELRKYHLVGATIRCYCVRHERIATSNTKVEEQQHDGTSIATTYFISRQMKLLHPDQSYGSDVWMDLPQVIVHRMDNDSPLVPPSSWYDGNGTLHASNEKSPSYDLLAQPLDKNFSDLDFISNFLIDRDAEIVVLVEGTDEGTGSATQARHSYKVTDLAWNHTFAPCIFPFGGAESEQEEGLHRRSHPTCSVDFSRFHEIASVPDDCEACAYVPT